jgi:ribosomal protein L37AE/L43A
MNDPGFTEVVGELVGIMSDLDEFDTPKRKLPPCPRCDEDELGVIHANLMLCYQCGWKLEGKVVRGGA